MDTKRRKTIFVRAMYVMVIVAFAFSMVGSAFAQGEPPQFSLNIRAYIDGYSQLIIQGNNVYWHHIGAAAPGRHLFVNEPTYLNGTAWYPIWPDIPDAENKECNCDSSSFSDLRPALPENQGFVLNLIDARYSAFISQQPNTDNNYTLIVDFDDWPPDGPAWYEVELAIDTNIPNPRFDVRANTDQIEAWEWRVGDELTLTVNEDLENSITQTVGTAPWDSNTSYAIFNLQETTPSFDIQPGDVVSLTNGVVTKTTTLTTLAFTDINISLDTVSGTAASGKEVNIWACDSNGCYNRHIMANGIGEWLADFKVPGEGVEDQVIFNIVGGTWVDSQQVDEDGDKTMFGQNAPNPHFSVRANADQVEGWEWAYDDNVTLTINLDDEGGSDYTMTGTVGWAPWDTNHTQTYISFNLWGVYDIRPGDNVALNNDTVTKTTTVTDLAITGFDMVADTFTGIAASGSRVDVWVCDPSNCYNRHINAESGAWLADFSEPGDEDDEQNTFEIVLGNGVESQQVDEDDDRTMFSHNLPNYIETHPQYDDVSARGWFRGTDLTMTIRSGSDEVYTAEATMDQAPWNPGDPYDVIAIFPMNGFDLQPGHEITISGGEMTKTYLVANPQVTSIDIAADTISGIATPGTKVQVCVQIPDSCISRNTTAESSGEWTVDYSETGGPSDTPEIFDLQPGSYGWMYESDNDGDQTWADDWRVPPPPPTPFIWADPLCECINGWDWSDGDNITIQVFDQGGDELELQNPTQVYSAESGVFFDLGGDGIDLQPGYRITMTNGVIAKELLVTKLVVKEMDPVANTISGVYDPAFDLVVYTGDQEPLNLEFEGDKWIATFESVPLDGFGEAYQPDEDGDKTGMGWDGVPTFLRYDIYAFDVQSNGNERITTLDGTGEYDPSWSPNGRKVAHDVVYWDGSQGIYTTDVKTGISQPLKGAGDGGNDAAWSPNGLLIAFDRRWMGDESIYIVPFTGGQRRLVHENAVSPSWSPNGLRIVYQDLADGGKVKTVGLLGNVVITVADYGENPAWSPDGKWIAYSSAGDIWKVRVGPLGTPYGDPILVADMEAWIGLPTWSDDSRTIVFDGGEGDDWDLWSVPATGGESTWLTGVPGYGDYGPDYWRNLVAYAGYTP